MSTEDRAVIDWILNQAGLNAQMYRAESLSRRVAATLRMMRVHTLVQAKSAIQHEPRLLSVALSSLIIGVSSFFRDPMLFAALDGTALAALCQKDDVRIWSAGCSDGAELFSVAMLMAERNSLHRCQFLGTDCRPDAIRAAFEGRYDASELAAVPPALLERYFVAQRDGGATIRGWLRTVPQWKIGNVLRTIEAGEWDLILCRNMAMYLAAPAAQCLWQSLAEAIRPGGFLVPGRAERPRGAANLNQIAPCLYQRSKN